LTLRGTTSRKKDDPRTTANPHAVVIIGVALLHCTYALWRTQDPRFLLFVVYGFIHAGLLIPLRLRALTTLPNNAWGTRGQAPEAALSTSAPVFASP
jgi:hypothetical protein